MLIAVPSAQCRRQHSNCPRRPGRRWSARRDGWSPIHRATRCSRQGGSATSKSSRGIRAQRAPGARRAVHARRHGGGAELRAAREAGRCVQRPRRVKTHASLDAAPAATPARFPVIVFQHGYTGLPSSHTALMEDLASHGWAVLNLIHPYEATGAMLADGTVVTFTDEKNAMRAGHHGRAQRVGTRGRDDGEDHRRGGRCGERKADARLPRAR